VVLLKRFPSLLACFSSLATAGSVVGQFDPTQTAANQEIFLSPSGRILSLDPNGDKRLAPFLPDTARIGLQAGEYLDGTSQVGYSSNADTTNIWSKVKTPSGVPVLVRYGVCKSTHIAASGPKRMTLNSGVGASVWWKDTLFCLDTGKIRFIPGQEMTVFHVDANLSLTGLTGLQAWYGANSGLMAWNSTQAWYWTRSGTTWATPATWTPSPAATIAAVGMLTPSKLVALQTNGHVIWQGISQVDSVPGSLGQFLPDSGTTTILYWQPSERRIWRLAAGSKQLLATGLEDVITPATTTSNTVLLVGGTLAAGVSLDQGKIRQLGQFHHLGGLGISSFQVSPSAFSPRVGIGQVANITAAISSATPISSYTIKVVTQWGVPVKTILTGSSLPIGQLTTSWDGMSSTNTRQPYGLYKIVLDASGNGLTVSDTARVVLDTTAPYGKPGWSDRTLASHPNIIMMSPRDSLGINLNGSNPVNDDQDSTKDVLVHFVFTNTKTNQSYNLDLSKLALKTASNRYKFALRNVLPNGTSFPDGDYTFLWWMNDTIGNSIPKDSGLNSYTNGPRDTLRYASTPPGVRLSFSPYLFQATDPIKGILKVQVAGAAGSSDSISLLVDSKKVASRPDTVITLDAKGNFSCVWSLNLSALSLGTGVHTIQVVASYSGLAGRGSTTFQIGSLSPVLSFPANGDTIRVVSGDLQVRGTAVDPWVSATTGTPVYRLAIRRGSATQPSNPRLLWSSLSDAVWTRIPVTSSLAMGSSTSYQKVVGDDYVTLPNVGAVTGVAADQVLGRIPASVLAVDSQFTIGLWSGKNDSAMVAWNTFRIRHVADTTTRGILVQLLRPSSSILDWTVSDTAQHRAVWRLATSKTAALQWSATLWSGNAGTRVVGWNWSSTTFDSIDTISFNGRKPDGTFLAAGSWSLSVTGSAPSGETWTTTSAITIRPPLIVPTDSTLTITPDTIDLSVAQILGTPHPKVQVNLPEDANTRVRILDNQGLLVSTLGPGVSAHWSATWNGMDTAGGTRLDPRSSGLSFLFVLEQDSGNGHWGPLKTDTLHVFSSGNSVVDTRDSAVIVEGTQRLGNLEADLLSDYKLRVQANGQLVYYPQRALNVGAYASGLQTARQYLGVDYSMEWAKYYNSGELQSNRYSDWAWGGQYISVDWVCFDHAFGHCIFALPLPVYRTDGGNRQQSDRSLRWFFAKDDSTALGERLGLKDSIQSPNTFSPLGSYTRVGIPALFDPSLPWDDSIQVLIDSAKINFPWRKVSWVFANAPKFSGELDRDPVQIAVDRITTHYEAWRGNYHCQPTGDSIIDAYTAEACDLIPYELMNNYWPQIGDLPSAQAVDSTLTHIAVSPALMGDYQLPFDAGTYSAFQDLGRPMFALTPDNMCWGRAPNYREWDYFIGPSASIDHSTDTTGRLGYYLLHRGVVPNSSHQSFFTSSYGADGFSVNPDQFQLYNPGLAFILDAGALWFSDPNPGSDNASNVTLGSPNTFLRYSTHNTNGDTAFPGERWYLDVDAVLGELSTDRYYYNYHSNGPADFALRDQKGYTVPPRMNWMNPTLYMHDSTVTVEHQFIYADDAEQYFNDGIGWDNFHSGKQIAGQSEFGGYKSGQRGYWFRPSQLQYDVKHDTGLLLPRSFRHSLLTGKPLSEMDFVQNYPHHVRWDSTNVRMFTHHNLGFMVRLKVNDTTRGVVWDTISVHWPQQNYGGGLLPEHLDTVTLASHRWGTTGITDTGINFAAFRVMVSPDSTWDARNPAPSTQDSTVVLLRPLFPNLPDEIYTSSDSSHLRAHRLYSFVYDTSLSWQLAVSDTLGNLLGQQAKLAWHMDTAGRWASVPYRSLFEGSRTGFRRNPLFVANYQYNSPDIMGNWSSALDSRLASTGGWLYYRKNFQPTSFTTVQKNIQFIGFLKIPDSSVARYRPWSADAFVRVGPAVGPDTVRLNPNLTKNNSVHWTTEIYYVDGETRNRDIDTSGQVSLDHLDLRLSASQSSQRFVRLKGRFHNGPPGDSTGWAIRSWKAWGIKDSVWTPLQVPRRYTDSLNRFVGIRNASGDGDFWYDSTQFADVAYWNITGLEGSAQFACQVVYQKGVQTQTVWEIRPFVIGSRRDTADTTTVTDAYARAQLALPPSASTDSRPVVLHTIAGSDLQKLPVPGLVPAGPVVQMLPSGMTFSPPAQISYRLSLREVLHDLYPDSAGRFDTMQQAGLLSHWPVWDTIAHHQLALYLLNDQGQLQAIPTVILVDGVAQDSVSAPQLDATFFQLQGAVSHFSYCVPLAGPVSQNVPPRFDGATWNPTTGLELLGDAADAKKLLGDSLPKSVRIHLQKDSIADTTKALLGPRNVSLDYMAHFDSTWADTSLTKLPNGNIWAFARFPGAKAWARIRFNRDLRGPTISNLRALTPRISSTCGDSLRLFFNSSKDGTYLVKILDSTRNMVDVQTFVLTAGADLSSWSPCVLTTSLRKGRYGAFIEPKDAYGHVSIDTLSQFVRFGIDTFLPSIDSLTATPSPFRRNLTGIGSGLLVNAYVESVPAGWQARLRARMGDSGAWTDVGAFTRPSTGLFQATWNGKIGTSPVPAGTAALQIVMVQDSSLRQLIRVAVDTTSLIATLVAKPDTIVVGTGTSLNLAVTVSESARIVVKLQKLSDSTKTLRILGSGIPWLLPDSASWNPAGGLSLSLGSTRTDSLRGAWVAILRVSDLHGQGWEQRDTVFFKGNAPRLTRIAMAPASGDTIWPQVDQARLMRMPPRPDGSYYQQKATLTVSSDKAGRVLRTVRRGTQILGTDTLTLTSGTQVFAWNDTASGAQVTTGSVTLEYRAMDLLGTLADSSLVQNLWVERMPRAVIWAANPVNPDAVNIRSYLQARQVDTRIYPSQWVLQYLDLAPTGTVILADSALSSDLYSGGQSGALFPWCLAGGNLVFTGAPAFTHVGTAATDSQDIRRQRIYGSDPLRQPWASAYLRDYRQGSFKVRLIDPLIKGAFQIDTGARLATSVDLQWLDSVGIQYEAGASGPHLDSLHRRTAAGADTIVLDTTQVGAAMYYPPRFDSSTARLGALGEFPRVSGAAQDSGYGQWLYVHFFAPDLGIYLPSTRLVIHPYPGHDTIKTWKPLRKDTVECRVTVQFRSSDLVPSLDTVRILEIDAANHWKPDTVLLTHVNAGRYTLPVFRHVLDTSHPFNEDALEVRILPFRQKSSVSGTDTLKESYLPNNNLDLGFVVGDTVLPILHFHGATLASKGVWTSSRPLGVQVPHMVEAALLTRHKSLPFQLHWAWAKNPVVGRTDTLSIPGPGLQDSTIAPWLINLPNSVHDGDQVTITLSAQDRYGSKDSAKLLTTIDALAPEITSIAVSGHALPKDTSQAGVDYRRCIVTRLENALGHVPAIFQFKDNLGLDSAYIISTSGASIVKTWGAGVKQDTLGMQVVPDRQATPTPQIYSIVLVDRAGNKAHTTFSVEADSAINPPITVYTFDSSRVDSITQLLSVQRKVRANRLRTMFPSGDLLETTFDSTQPTLTRVRNATRIASLVGTSHAELQVQPGIPLHLSISSPGPNPLTTWRMWLDGKLITTTDTAWSAYPKLDTLDAGMVTALGNATRQKMIRFTPTGREQVLKILAIDNKADTTSGEIIFYGPDGDLQVIDSANDAQGHGPDFGEVYMRADTLHPQGNPQVWTYWLLHLRDADSAAGVDLSAHPWILLDPSNDTSTGCRVPGRPKLSGFKTALELVPGDGTDSSTGAKLLSWSCIGKQWVSDSRATIHERSVLPTAGDSTLLGANQNDDPLTATPGEGNQMLPNGVVAKATNGAWEIGWLTPWRDTIGTLRWAIVPSLAQNQSIGDTVTDTAGAVLVFHPRRMRSVTVDGFTDDWLPPGHPTLDVYSSNHTVKDTVFVNLSVINPGLRAVRGFKLRYFFTDQNGATSAKLDTSAVVSWVRPHLRVMGPGRASNLLGYLESNIYYVEVDCDSCVLGTGGAIQPLGTLKLVGSLAHDTLPSWSATSDASHPNRLIPAYDSSSHLISGQEPTRRALRPIALSIQVISGDPAHLVPGSQIILRATVTDPENRNPLVRWSNTVGVATGTGRYDTIIFAQNGAYALNVVAADPEIFDRNTDTTLVFWVGVSNLGSVSGIRIDSSCGCPRGLSNILQEVAPFTVAPEVLGLRWLLPSEATSFQPLRAEHLPSNRPEGAIFNNPYLPTRGPEAPLQYEPEPCSAIGLDPDQKDPQYGRYRTLPGALDDPTPHAPCAEGAR
jgi:hypothetical protein